MAYQQELYRIAKDYVKPQAIKKKNLIIKIKLGLGKTSFSVLTSDFSEDYLLINSDYRS